METPISSYTSAIAMQTTGSMEAGFYAYESASTDTAAMDTPSDSDTLSDELTDDCEDNPGLLQRVYFHVVVTNDVLVSRPVLMCTRPMKDIQTIEKLSKMLEKLYSFSSALGLSIRAMNSYDEFEPYAAIPWYAWEEALAARKFAWLYLCVDRDAMCHNLVVSEDQWKISHHGDPGWWRGCRWTQFGRPTRSMLQRTGYPESWTTIDSDDEVYLDGDGVFVPAGPVGQKEEGGRCLCDCGGGEEEGEEVTAPAV